ncbi:FAD:protein FMN transferase [Paludibacter sp.]
MNIKQLIICLVTVSLFACQNKPEYIKNSGSIFGTYYHVTYQQSEGKDLHELIKNEMQKFDMSLSTYNPNSIISRINSNDETIETDEFFNTMFVEAQSVSANTGGAFDITVAPLVNEWGFGFGNHERKEIPKIDSILSFIGYQKVTLKNNHIFKQDRRMMLDASAIAKGLSSDVIGKLLSDNGCKNYMVEIGGEIACKGVNPDGKKWIIGIDKPIDDSFVTQRELQTTLAITDCGLATSGNYRQFYYRDGKKYAHTINPRTGYPVEHNLLSATVIASSCMRADAYATAFMVLGVDSSLAVCKRTPDVECYLIFEDNQGKYQIVYTDSFDKYFNE